MENASLKQTLDVLVKEKGAVEKKYETLSGKMSKLESQLNEEKQINKCLTDNQIFYKSKLTELEETMKRNDEAKNNVSFRNCEFLLVFFFF
jgi:BRCA1-associated protein